MKIAVVLIVLHGPSGNEIRVNPNEVTSLRAASPDDAQKHFTEGVRCMVSLTDGKYATVVEPCEVVQQMMRENGNGR